MEETERENNLSVKKLSNGLEVTIRRFNPYGMWRIGYDSFGRNKRTIAKYCSGEFTSLEEAEKALDSFVNKEGLEVVA